MILYKVAEQAQQDNDGISSARNSINAIGSAGLAGYGAYRTTKNEMSIKNLESLEKDKDKLTKIYNDFGIDPKARDEMFEGRKKELENLKKARVKNALFLLGGTAGMLGFNHLESKKDNKKYKDVDNLASDMEGNVAGSTLGMVAGAGTGLFGASHALLGDRKKAWGYAAATVPLLTSAYLSSNRFSKKAKNNKDLLKDKQ